MLEHFLTYAQNLCYGLAAYLNLRAARYQTHSARKSLIYIENLKCFFSGQSKENVDLRALTDFKANLSTKLSTENLNIYKSMVNQQLSGACGYFFEETRPGNLLKKDAETCPAEFFGSKKNNFGCWHPAGLVKVSGVLKITAHPFDKASPSFNACSAK